MLTTRQTTRRSIVLGVVLDLLLLAVTRPGFGTENQTPNDLKKLSIDQLLEVEITSVARKPQRISESASAIEVITAEDIRRSGATTIPDLLRLTVGLHVARIDGHTWAISARGFNTNTANKMQVLMDGRSLYTPLYSGVFWDAQDTLLEDIARIEVIRGPGATMWGSNAVNGVINIITKHARDTQHPLAVTGAGKEETGFGAFRYGGRWGSDSFYRTYLKYQNQNQLIYPDRRGSNDGRQNGQAGFRLDSARSDRSSFSLQGDLYHSALGQNAHEDIRLGGGNVIARWTNTYSDRSNLAVQLYYDRTDRDIPGQFKEGRNTYDFDLQHRTAIGSRNDIIWGLNYRLSHDKIGTSAALAFVPDNRTVQYFSYFLQDEITIREGRLGLIVGSKVEHSSFSPIEIQPTARLAWTPRKSQTLWLAASRAVRTPTQIDQDFVIPGPGGTILLEGNPDFKSEELVAYESGYRIQVHPKLSVELNGFYNTYARLRTLESKGPALLPITFDNKRVGATRGIESSVNFQPAMWWRVSVSHALLVEKLRLNGDSRASALSSSEGNDPRHRLVLRSSMDLPGRLELDCFFRYIGALPNPIVPSYGSMDLRLGWKATKQFELAVVGRDLSDEAHREFGAPTATARLIQRSFYVRFAFHPSEQ